MAILLAILAHLGYAVGDIFGTVSTRRLGPILTSFWIYIIGLIVFAPGVFIYRHSLTAEYGVIIVNALLGILLIPTYIGFNKALQIGNAPLVGAIAGSFPAVVVILSLIFYNETLKPGQVVAIAGVIVGIVLSSVDLRSLLARKSKLDITVKYALIALVGWGIYFTFIRYPIEHYGWFWANYISSVAGSALMLIIVLKSTRPKLKVRAGSFAPLLAAALLVDGGTMAFNGAISLGQSSVVAPIAGSYPALFVLLAYFIFKDRLTRQQLLGVGVTLASVIVLSIISA